MDVVVDRSRLERKGSLGLVIPTSAAILAILVPTGQPTRARTSPTTTATRPLTSQCALHLTRKALVSKYAKLAAPCLPVCSFCQVCRV